MLKINPKFWISLGVLMLAVSPMAAPLLVESHPLAALAIRSFFSGLCHQNPLRSFALRGSPVAVCVRCLGIYFGVALGSVLRAHKSLLIRWFSLALLLNVLDVATEILGWHGNWTLPRFLFGVLLGGATGAILFLPQTFSLPGRPRGLR